MSKYIILLTISLLFISNTTVFSKQDEGNSKSKNPNQQNAFREDHPVFGDGRKHPVHDDKVIGKYKNNSYTNDSYEKDKESNTNTISSLDRVRINNLIEDIDNLFNRREELQTTKAKLKNYLSSQPEGATATWKRYRLKIVNSQLASNRERLIKAIDKLAVLSTNDSDLSRRIRNYNNRINR